MSRFGIVTGMVAEADRLAVAARALPETARPLIACAGGDPARAAAQARGFANERVSGLVSFGIAGGLDPSLAPGDTVLADRVVAPAGVVYRTDADWRHAVAATLADICPTQQGAVAGADSALTRPAEKAELRRRTAALAVDMESHAVAAAAAQAGLPLLILRVVADPAGRAIPSCALSGIAAGGRRRPFAVLARLVIRPWELPGLIRIAQDSAAAMRSLSAAAPALLCSKED